MDASGKPILAPSRRGWCCGPALSCSSSPPPRSSPLSPSSISAATRRARSVSRSATRIISRCRQARSRFSSRAATSRLCPHPAASLIALAFLANMAAGIYHAGVEWKWWPGPTECTGAFELQMGRGRRRRYAGDPLRRGLLALPRAVLRRLERAGLGLPCGRRLRRAAQRRWRELTPNSSERDWPGAIPGAAIAARPVASLVRKDRDMMLRPPPLLLADRRRRLAARLASGLRRRVEVLRRRRLRPAQKDGKPILVDIFARVVPGLPGAESDPDAAHARAEVQGPGRVQGRFRHAEGRRARAEGDLAKHADRL